MAIDIDWFSKMVTQSLNELERELDFKLEYKIIRAEFGIWLVVKNLYNLHKGVHYAYIECSPSVISMTTTLMVTNLDKSLWKHIKAVSSWLGCTVTYDDPIIDLSYTTHNCCDNLGRVLYKFLGATDIMSDVLDNYSKKDNIPVWFEVGMKFGSVKVAKRSANYLHLKSLETGLSAKLNIESFDDGRECVDVDLDTCEWLGVVESDKFFEYTKPHIDRYSGETVYRLFPKDRGEQEWI